MSKTKTDILTLLKRNGGHTVGELAVALSLAQGTIRQHLTHLERDGLVLADQRSEGNGRPAYLFRLSARAHAAAFPRRSDRLVELLVREVGFLEAGELDGRSRREKTSLVVRRLAHRLADDYAPLLDGWSLQERVSFTAEVMHADGGFAEWEQTGRGFEIRDFNCIFHRLLDNDPDSDVCEWHRAFLTRMLGVDDVRVVPCADDAGQCCRYLVEAPVEAATLA